MPGGESRILATNRIVVRDSEGNAKHLVVVIDDITERKKSEQRIAFMAHHDVLTGLPNRLAVMEKIEEAVARHRRRGDSFAILLLDLDRFKHVNDTLGHAVGDTLLRETASRLKASLRETDVLARLGGDEFAIVQDSESNQREAASALANRVIEIVSRIQHRRQRGQHRDKCRHCLGPRTCDQFRQPYENGGSGSLSREVGGSERISVLRS